MATRKQREAAKKNIKKAQKSWQEMTAREHSLAQPEGRDRKKPGEAGEGDYYRIVLRPKEQFVTFRYHDVGEKKGDLIRLAGKRQSGSWDTQAWLISKKSAHVSEKKLIADTDDARELLEDLGSEPVHIKGDIFQAKDRPNIPEKDKPTSTQKQARIENIAKAQEMRWAGSSGGRAKRKR